MIQYNRRGETSVLLLLLIATMAFLLLATTEAFQPSNTMALSRRQYSSGRGSSSSSSNSIMMTSSPLPSVGEMPDLFGAKKKKENENAKKQNKKSKILATTQPKYFWEKKRKRKRRQTSPAAFEGIQSSWRRRRNFVTELFRPNRSPLDAVSKQLFEDADSNGDGIITVSEAYEFVLQMYIVMNRHAELSPPTKEKVEQLFYEYDNNRLDRGLNRDEFMELIQHFSQRAVSTMVAHKWVTLVGAPLLTEGVLRYMGPAAKRWCDPFLRSILPKRLLPVVTSITFLRSILLMFFATTLADVVLSTVNWILDMTTPEAEPPDIAGTIMAPIKKGVEESKKMVDKNMNKEEQSENDNETIDNENSGEEDDNAEKEATKDDENE